MVNRAIVAGALAVGLMLVPAATAPAGAAAARTSGHATWRILPTPSSGTLNQLNASDAVSASDVWAVGTTGLPDFNSLGVTEHWDGTAWSVVPSPNPPDAAFVNLLAVSAASSGDVWAVGRWAPTGSFSDQALALHWDGTAWSVVPVPALSGGATFQGVKAISADDVWTVGQDGSGTLAEHWDGTAWTVVATPNEQAGGDLTAVGASGSTDVWAVGSFLDKHFDTHSMILHWDGTAWSVSPSPETGASSELEGVSALSPTDAWAVGHSLPSNVATLTEHWNGSKWSVVPGPNVPVSQFHAVVMLSSGDVWAVGSYIGAGAEPQTLAERWNGVSWAPSRTPAVNAISEFLGVSATSRVVLAVGDAELTPESPQQTLAEARPG